MPVSGILFLYAFKEFYMLSKNFGLSYFRIFTSQFTEKMPIGSVRKQKNAIRKDIGYR